MIIKDVIVEEIVKKKKTANDKLTMLGTVVCCILMHNICYTGKMV